MIARVTRSLVVALAGLLLAGSAIAQSPSPRPTATTDLPPAGANESGRSVLSGTRPDIVLVLLDDLGEMDDRVFRRLPVISRLFLDGGVRFSDFVVTFPLCCPSRASFLTGLIPMHHGVLVNDARLFDPSVTIATELQATGYTTLYAGKYFNFTELLEDHRPPGWSRSLISSGGTWDYDAWLDGEPLPHGTEDEDHFTDLIARTALDFLREAPRDRPVFLQVAPFVPHTSPNRDGILDRYFPYPAPRHNGDPRCSGITPWRPPGHVEADFADKPVVLEPDRRGQRIRWPAGFPLDRHCETLLGVDEMIGALEVELAAQGRTDVLFVLTSDNGMLYGAHRRYGKDIAYAADVPFFAAWPGRLGATPRTVDALAANIDLAPTLCDLAGCLMGPFPDRPAADGISLLPLLAGEETAPARLAVPLSGYRDRKTFLTWSGVRTAAGFPGGRQLFVEWSNGEKERYDLLRDPWLLENDADDPWIAPLIRQLEIAHDALFQPR